MANNLSDCLSFTESSFLPAARHVGGPPSRIPRPGGTFTTSTECGLGPSQAAGPHGTVVTFSVFCCSLGGCPARLTYLRSVVQSERRLRYQLPVWG